MTHTPCMTGEKAAGKQRDANETYGSVNSFFFFFWMEINRGGGVLPA